MDLFKNFTNISDKLFEGKLLQPSMDGPSLNLKFYEDVSKDRNEKGLHQLMNIGTCGLHTTHGAFKTGAEKSDWNLRSNMKASSTILLQEGKITEVLMARRSIHFHPVQQDGLKISLLLTD